MVIKTPLEAVQTGELVNFDGYLSKCENSALALEIIQQLKKSEAYDFLCMDIDEYYPDQLVEFFKNAEISEKTTQVDGEAVKVGILKTKVSGKVIDLERSMLHEHLKLSDKGLDAHNSKYKPTERFWKKIASKEDSDVNFSCKLRGNLKKEFELLSEMMSKTLEGKAGAHDALTNNRAFLMQRIMEGEPINWSDLMYTRLIEQVQKEQKKGPLPTGIVFRYTKTYGLHISHLLKKLEIQVTTGVVYSKESWLFSTAAFAENTVGKKGKRTAKSSDFVDRPAKKKKASKAVSEFGDPDQNVAEQIHNSEASLVSEPIQKSGDATADSSAQVQTSTESQSTGVSVFQDIVAATALQDLRNAGNLLDESKGDFVNSLSITQGEHQLDATETMLSMMEPEKTAVVPDLCLIDRTEVSLEQVLDTQDPMCVESVLRSSENVVSVEKFDELDDSELKEFSRWMSWKTDGSKSQEGTISQIHELEEWILKTAKVSVITPFLSFDALSAMFKEGVREARLLAMSSSKPPVLEVEVEKEPVSESDDYMESDTSVARHVSMMEDTSSARGLPQEDVVEHEDVQDVAVDGQNVDFDIPNENVEENVQNVVPDIQMEDTQVNAVAGQDVDPVFDEEYVRNQVSANQDEGVQAVVAVEIEVQMNESEGLHENIEFVETQPVVHDSEVVEEDSAVRTPDALPTPHSESAKAALFAERSQSAINYDQVTVEEGSDEELELFGDINAGVEDKSNECRDAMVYRPPFVFQDNSEMMAVLKEAAESLKNVATVQSDHSKVLKDVYDSMKEDRSMIRRELKEVSNLIRDTDERRKNQADTLKTSMDRTEEMFIKATHTMDAALNTRITEVKECIEISEKKLTKAFQNSVNSMRNENNWRMAQYADHKNFLDDILAQAREESRKGVEYRKKFLDDWATNKAKAKKDAEEQKKHAELMEAERRNMDVLSAEQVAEFKIKFNNGNLFAGMERLDAFIKHLEENSFGKLALKQIKLREKMGVYKRGQGTQDDVMQEAKAVKNLHGFHLDFSKAAYQEFWRWLYFDVFPGDLQNVNYVKEVQRRRNQTPRRLL